MASKVKGVAVESGRPVVKVELDENDTRELIAKLLRSDKRGIQGLVTSIMAGKAPKRIGRPKGSRNKEAKAA